MNICFITSEYVNPIGGGVERVTYNLYNALKDYGHKVYVISKEKPQQEDTLKDKFYHLPNSNPYSEEDRTFLKNYIIEHDIVLIVNNSHHQSVFELLVSVKREQPFKLISAYHSDPQAIVKGVRDSWDAMMAVKRNRILLPYYACRYWVKYYLRKKYQKEKFRSLYKDSDAIVLLSEYFVPQLLDIIGVKQSDKVFAIPNPIIKNKFGETNIKSKEKNVLYVGRMEQEAKRPDRIIRIWKRVSKQYPDWKLYMIGDGTLKSTLEEYCNRKNIKNVVFTGQMDPTKFYLSSQVLCCTSTYEGFGLVLTEALQYGVIPIAFDSYASVHDIIENNYNGFLVKPFKLRHYEKCLAGLLNDASKRDRIRDNILSSMNSIFDMDLIVNKWNTIFDNLFKNDKK